MADDTLSLILFSGTDDKLQAAAVLTVGAAAMERKVNIFLQYWALDCFRADGIMMDHGVAPEAGEAGLRAMQNQGKTHWSELFGQAKDLGEVQSLRLLGLDGDAPPHPGRPRSTGRRHLGCRELLPRSRRAHHVHLEIESGGIDR